jgi:3-hydroxyisobutyrate dehydrogenase/glyoxylate/succinic semialdehyde reductase
MKMAFLGLGIMGSRMAANLVKAGYELTVWNRTGSSADGLVASGARFADSPQKAAAGADVVFTMLSTPEVVEQIAAGPQGFLSAMHPGAIWIDSSTVNPSFSRRMAALAESHQVRFIDAPVAGSRGPAEKGELLFLVGGNAQDVEQIRPLLDRMGKRVVHAGGHGMGSALKMVFNLILGEVMAAYAEGLVLGEALGLSKEILFDSLIGSAVAAPMLQAKRAKIETGDFSPDFPLEWIQKDLQLAATSAYEQGLALPAVNTAKELYALAKRRGYAEQDLSALYAFLQEGYYTPIAR